MMPRLSLLYLFAAAMLPFALGTIWPAAGQAGVLICLLVFLFSLIDLVLTPSLLAMK